MFFNKDKKITAAVEGIAIDIKDVKDDMFANELMGLGLAITPTSTTICAPVDGEITLFASTKHAFGLKTKDDLEVLVHLGVDTVKYEGKGFTKHLDEGAKVKAGQPIVEYDYEFFKNEGLDISVMTILLNHTEYTINDIVKSGNVSTKDVVANYKK